MDLAAEYYMQTIETVFVRHALPKGEMTHRGRLVDLKAIRKSGLLSVEGEKDDISGVGQTCAANELVRQYPRVQKALSSGRRGSAITACSTAPASATRSPRASASSSRGIEADGQPVKPAKLNGARRPKSA